MAIHRLAKFHFETGNLDVASKGPVMSFGRFTVRIGEGYEPGEIGVQVLDHVTGDIAEYGEEGSSVSNITMADLTDECRRSLEFAAEKWRKG